MVYALLARGKYHLVEEWLGLGECIKNFLEGGFELLTLDSYLTSVEDAVNVGPSESQIDTNGNGDGIEPPQKSQGNGDGIEPPKDSD